MDTILIGADIGATKTLLLITDGSGRTLGAGEAGPGNPEFVGYDGMARAVQDATSQALAASRLRLDDVSAAGMGGVSPAAARVGRGAAAVELASVLPRGSHRRNVASKAFRSIGLMM